jgi:Uma2 family endonuclease
MLAAECGPVIVCNFGLAATRVCVPSHAAFAKIMNMVSTVPIADAMSSTLRREETVVHRLTLHGVPWLLYEQLLAVVGDGLPRMTYDRGMLEMEMPSEKHESLKWIAGRFIEAYLEESSFDFRAVGSTTWRRQAIEGGVEADESYYIQNHQRVRGREVDLATDPPPDLAVEIDLSPPDVEKTSVYARLAVPEIWRWRDGRLGVLAREPDGRYAERPRSVALPEFPLAELAAALEHYPQNDPARSVAEFRRRLRERLHRG